MKLDLPDGLLPEAVTAGVAGFPGAEAGRALAAVRLLAGLGTAGSGAVSAGAAKPAENGIAAPVSGTLQAFKVADGAEVAEGELVAIMEAMKMETQVLAPRAGRLRLRVKEGDYLQAGDTLMVFEG